MKNPFGLTSPSEIRTTIQSFEPQALNATNSIFKETKGHTFDCK